MTQMAGTKFTLKKAEREKQTTKANAILRKEKIKRLRLLFEDFPAEFDVFEELDRKLDWTELERTETFTKTYSFELSAINKVRSLIGTYKPIYNFLSSFAFDILFFKIGSRSIAEFIKENRERYIKIPVRNLKAPNLILNGDLSSQRKQMHYFAVYCEMKAVLDLLDICLAQDKGILFEPDLFAKRFYKDDVFFVNAINLRPQLLQSLSCFLRIKFYSPFGAEPVSSLVNQVKLSSYLDLNTSDSLAIKRAFFFIQTFDPTLVELPDADLLAEFKNLGICTVSYKSDAFKKSRAKFFNNELKGN